MYTKTLSQAVFKTAQVGAIVFALMLVYAVLPMPARAATLTDTQMTSVLSLLQSFNIEQSVLDNVQLALKGASRAEVVKAIAAKVGSTTAMHPNMPAASICGIFARTLARGTVGEDVNRLQEFLKQSGFLSEASTTSYFGPSTEAALQKWQAKEGVVTNGDAVTTGFGALGPKTRDLLMARCKGDGASLGQSTSNARPALSTAATNSSTAPVCTLRASKQHVASGESVTLRWESRNATWASMPDGSKGEPNGSITVNPTETATYLKHVYNDQNEEGQCTATITVGDDRTPAADMKVVVVPPQMLMANVLVGAEVVGELVEKGFEAYVGLFR